ncbi:MAG: hypothetical protein ISN26_00425 [Betaproteobacteria bacterium AqS2]|uniref:Uncharacterized protein n=1 Tax=Candidatus Amphirhobacter heronislandensis TaxID=1732024 RepID=A0A930XVZ4_9GAMM|nr:hypothetical protein [Betaproteobacteria bacterium AqS2]
MSISLESLAVRPVERHSLRFKTRDNFEEACKQCTKEGFLVFRNGDESDLVGRLVRINRRHLIIEVDAASDLAL